MAKSKVKTEKYELPTFWCGALFYGEYDSMNDEEIVQFQRWLKRYKPGCCVDVAEQKNFAQFEGIGHEVAEYTFIKKIN